MLRVGIDIGGTNIVVGLVDENNEIVGKAWTPTRSFEGLETVVNDVVNCFNNALAFSGFDKSDCVGIGIGSPGTCDAENGVALHVHHLGIDSAPYCEMITARTGIKSYLDNDANCAALGEVVAGAAKDCSSALMITLGTGVGGGFVVDGNILRGFKSLGGEFGHICIAIDGIKCACGENGCWDAYASGAALVAQAEAAAENNPDSILNTYEIIDGAAVFDAASKNDAAAVKVLNRYFEYVGVGIVNIINCVYPEVIIIGGGVSAAGDVLIDGVQDYINKHIFVKDEKLAPKVVKAQLGNDAGIIGAAALCV